MSLFLSFVSILMTLPLASMGDWWYGFPLGFTIGIFIPILLERIMR